jgi:hypothetical protein
MGKGSISSYVDCGVKAILSLRDQCIFLLSEEERLEISARIKSQYFFKHWAGIIDGTHLGFSTRPENCGEEYFTRKGQHAILALIIVDDKKRIHHTSVGWPGSVHDNHIWSNSRIVLSPRDYFPPNKYAIGNSAFPNSNIMVTSYKRASGQAFLPARQSWFNNVRSDIENTIGTWKS